MSEPTEIYTFHRSNAIPYEDEKNVEYQSKILKVVSSALISMLLASGQVLQSIWPFAPAFVAAVLLVEGRKYAVPLLLGCATGLFLGKSGYIFLNLLPVFMMSFLLVIGRSFLLRSSWNISLCVFIVIILIKGTYFLVGGYPQHFFIELFFEAILAAGLSLAFARGLEGLHEFRKGGFCTKDHTVGLVVLAVAILISLMNYEVLLWNLGRWAAITATLVIAYLYGAGYGAAMGVVAGITPGMIHSFISPYAGIFALSGFLAGALKGFNKPGSLLGFSIGQIGIAYFLFYIEQVDVLAVESITAALVFLVVPARTWKRLFAFIPGDTTSSLHTEQLVVKKIGEISTIFRELAKTFRQISDDFNSEGKNRYDQILKSLTEKVCTGCSVFLICWQKEKKSTCQNICTLFNLIEAQGKIDREDLPGELRKRCVRPDELVAVAWCLFDMYLMDKYYKKKLNETRGLVAEQLIGVSAVINFLAADLTLTEDSLIEKEAILSKKLQEMGLEIMDLKLIPTSDQSLELEIVKEPCKGKMECNLLIKPYLEEVFNEGWTVDRSKCAVKNSELLCRCRIRPAAALKISIGFSQVKSEGSVVCGDNYKSFDIRGGKKVIVLSDGMGVGPRAARESNTAISLLEQLLINGFDKEVAIQTVNSVLMIRSEEETFATLDLVIIDIYTSKVEFIKIGAAPSFLKRANQIGIIKGSAYPIGILNAVDVSIQVKHLRRGDIIVMVSDGVLDSGEFNDKEAWMVDVLKDLRVGDPHELSQMVLKHSIAVIPDHISDDMTVLAIKLE
ncbi:MAG: stage II sporulation protein E [Bacillota bacterium]